MMHFSCNVSAFADYSGPEAGDCGEGRCMSAAQDKWLENSIAELAGERKILQLSDKRKLGIFLVDNMFDNNKLRQNNTKMIGLH